jgi:hypothetical protein
MLENLILEPRYKPEKRMSKIWSPSLNPSEVDPSDLSFLDWSKVFLGGDAHAPEEIPSPGPRGAAIFGDHRSPLVPVPG